MASCNVRTSEKPNALAAASIPPNFVASAETLVPRQFLDPGVPANRGAGCINVPKAVGSLPTGIGESITVLVAVLITDTVLLRKLATYLAAVRGHGHPGRGGANGNRGAHRVRRRVYDR